MNIDREIWEILQSEYLYMRDEVQFVSDFMVSVGREEGQYRLPQGIISQILGDKFVDSAQLKDSFALNNITLNDAAVDGIYRVSSSGPVVVSFITRFNNKSGQKITVKVELTDQEFEELKGAIAAEIQSVLKDFKDALLDEAGKSVSSKRHFFRIVSEKVFDVNQLRDQNIDFILAYLYNQVGKSPSIAPRISNEVELRGIIADYYSRIYKGRGLIRVSASTVRHIYKACNFVNKNTALITES